MTSMEYVICENCGRRVAKDQAVAYEDDFYCPECAEECLTTCERCGEKIPLDCAYEGFDGYLCECCHDDLFG